MNFNWYKNIFRGQKFRFFILKLLRFVPDSIMIRIQYKIKIGKFPKLNNPTAFTEKLQVYKLRYRDFLMPVLVDKFLVKNYLIENGYEDLVIKTHGIYNDFDAIDFDNLPNKFVIKTTQGGGGNNVFICKNKNQINMKLLKEKINYWLKLNPSKDLGREWVYNNKNKIIIEEFIEDQQNINSGIDDYKFFCFHGKPLFVAIDKDRFKVHRRYFLNIDWTNTNVQYNKYMSSNDIISPPKNYENMIEIARKLSNKFPFARVDLYNIDGKIKFGEITFFPSSGYIDFHPSEFDNVIGKELKLDLNKISMTRKL